MVMSYAVHSRNTENILNVPDILKRVATLISVCTILPYTRQYNMLVLLLGDAGV